ncbi:MAG: Gfo/Idh/MocA family oxidoreductase [Cyclobacteriaceae bacterium]|nr:Gfo/Idh/MocA family oxidoreductase [Cyclobacteriaceae bacterium]
MKTEIWKKIKVLVAGCGSIGKRHARILQEIGLEQIWIYDTNPSEAEATAAAVNGLNVAESYQQGLEICDAVFITTPTRLHIPMAIEALQQNCHVFIEKPVSDSSNGIDDLNSLTRKVNKKVMVGLCMRYHEGIRKTRAMLNEGKIGRLISIRSLVGEHFPLVHPNYKNMYYAKYSGAFEIMHDLDIALWMANQEVKSVYSIHGSYSDIEIEAPDHVEMLIGFEDRCTATVHLDFYQFPRRRNIELIGTKGVIITDFTAWDHYSISVFTQDDQHWEIHKGYTQRDDMFKEEDREFLEAIAFDHQINCTTEEACRSLRVIEAAQKGIQYPGSM